MASTPVARTDPGSRTQPPRHAQAARRARRPFPRTDAGLPGFDLAIDTRTRPEVAVGARDQEATADRPGRDSAAGPSPQFRRRRAPGSTPTEPLREAPSVGRC